MRGGALVIPARLSCLARSAGQSNDFKNSNTQRREPVMATQTKAPTRYAIQLGKDLIRNKAGVMHFPSYISATTAIEKLGLEAKYCEIIERQTRLLNTKVYHEKKTQRTHGKPKGSNQNRIEDAIDTKNKEGRRKRWDTLYAVIGISSDDNAPKVVHVLSNCRENAMEKAGYKHDMKPYSAVEGRLQGKMKQFIREMLIMAIEGPDRDSDEDA